MNLRWTDGKEFRWLDFDLENRPLSYAGNDWTTAEVTAIAASWVGQSRVRCWCLGEVSAEKMLTEFLKLYHQADGVTGHYIRKHDLPILNGALLELKLPLLGPKLTSDTCLDLVRKKDMSASQESLGEMFGVTHPKEHMSQPKWREANRLTPDGIKETKRRVRGDVRQHKALRAKLLEAGVLKAPRMWSP
jgi:hypothetical protein